MTGAYVIEEDYAVRIFELRRYKAPHVLIAAESMRKQHWLRSATGYRYVVSLKYVLLHLTSPAGTVRGEQDCYANVALTGLTLDKAVARVTVVIDAVFLLELL